MSEDDPPTGRVHVVRERQRTLRWLATIDASRDPERAAVALAWLSLLLRRQRELDPGVATSAMVRIRRRYGDSADPRISLDSPDAPSGSA